MTTAAHKTTAMLKERRRTPDEVTYAEPRLRLVVAVLGAALALSAGAVLLLGPFRGPQPGALMLLAGAVVGLVGMILWVRNETGRIEATLDFRHRVLRVSTAPLFGKNEDRVFFAADVTEVELIRGIPTRLMLRLEQNESFELDAGANEGPLVSLGTEIARVFEKPFRRSGAA